MSDIDQVPSCLAGQPHPSIAVKCETVFAAASANRTENNLSCRQNLLLYSSSIYPVLHDLNSNRHAPLFLVGHTEQVNRAHFIDTLEPSKGIYVLSTAGEQAIIWEVHLQDESTRESGHKILYRFNSEHGSFSTGCSLRLRDGSFLTLTTSLDGVISLWRNDSPVAPVLKADYLCFDAKLHLVPHDLGKDPFIFAFLAASDNEVHTFQLLENRLDHLLDIKGHQDWIKCVDLIDLPQDRGLEFLIATASQDLYVRVWHMRLVSHDVHRDRFVTNTTCSKFLAMPNGEGESVFRLASSLETVLSGHEAMIHGLSWFKDLPERRKLLLGVCSADKTISLWTSTVAEGDSNIYKPASVGVWKKSHSFGETGETNLPFLSICTVPSDQYTLYAHSLRGAIHCWRIDTSEHDWKPYPFVTGHFGPITDLSWEKSGSYLLSSSLDKTCRIHTVAKQSKEWREVARPLVHGLEVNCLVSMGSLQFAVGGEEKTIRTYGPTQFFLKSFKYLSSDGEKLDEPVDFDDFPKHAQLPALGLSNRGAIDPYNISGPCSKKSMQEDSWYGTSPLVEKLAQTEHLEDLPIEEILLQSTLWWETNKLFGHPNELNALAVNSKATFLASASRANLKDSADIIIWETGKFRKVSTLKTHNLTVTRLKFSPDDSYLLSVSRDRTWCLSKRNPDGQLRNPYVKSSGSASFESVHERMVLDCCWTHDSKYFMTVSRDKKAALWSVDRILESEINPSNYKPFVFEPEHTMQVVDSAFCKQLPDRSYLFAFGLENGSLQLHEISEQRGSWIRLLTIENICLSPFRRLAFRPRIEDDDGILLAIGGEDSILRLTRVQIES